MLKLKSQGVAAPYLIPERLVLKLVLTESEAR